MKIKKGTLIILIAIILAAIVLRFWGITSESYWIDESISIIQAQGNYATTLYLVENDIHPPAYFILLNFWMKFFGTSELASRSLSALFGVLAVIFAYLLAKKLFSEKVALITAILMTFSSVMIYYSQEARPYSLFVLLTLASFYFFIRYIKTKKNTDLIIYGIISVILIYTHLFAFLILLVQNIYLGYTYKFKVKKLTQGILCQASILICFIPWIPVLLTQLNNSINKTWIPKPDWTIILGTFRDFFGNYINLSIFLVLLIIIFSTKKFNKMEKDKVILLVLWILIPFAIIITYSLFNQSLYQVRYMLFTLPAILILFAVCIDKITEKHYIKYITLVIIIFFAITSIASQINRVDKDDWRSVVKYLKEHIKEKDIIIINPTYHQEPFIYYYDRECFDAKDMDSGNFNKHNILKLECAGHCTDNTFLNIPAGHSLKEYSNHSIWLINVKQELYDTNNSLFEYFSNKKNLTSQNKIGEVEIYLFE